MHGFGQKHRQQPKCYGSPAFQIQRNQKNHPITGKMPSRLSNNFTLMRCPDIGFDNNAARPPNDADETITPISNATHPQKITAECIGRTGQFAIAFPILCPAMVGKMHDLIIVAGKQHDKANYPTKKLIQIFCFENCPVR